MWSFFEFNCVLEGKEELLLEAPRRWGGSQTPTQQEPLDADKQTQGHTAEPQRPAVTAKTQSQPVFGGKKGEPDVPRIGPGAKKISAQMRDIGAIPVDWGPDQKLDHLQRQFPELSAQFQQVAGLCRAGWQVKERNPRTGERETYRVTFGYIVGGDDAPSVSGGAGGGRGGGGMGGGGGRAGGLGPAASKMAKALMLLRKLKVVDFTDDQGNSLPQGSPPSEDTIIVDAADVYRGSREDLANTASGQERRDASREAAKGWKTPQQKRQQAVRQRDLAQARDPASMTGPSRGESQRAMAEVQRLTKQLKAGFEVYQSWDDPSAIKMAAQALETLQGLWAKPLDDQAKAAVQKLAQALAKACPKCVKKEQQHKEWLEFYSLMEQYGV